MLNPSESELLRRGVELFNCGEFFECHEVLEQAWLGAKDEEKRFIQGLIQIAVGFHHLRRANLIGAERLLSAGMAKVQAQSRAQDWIDCAALIAATEPVVRSLQAGSATGEALAPQIQFVRR